MEAVIRAVDLTKDFTDFWGRPKNRALDRLNLEVHPGEVFGLLGPNGSGKTTSMKLFLGLLYPSSGHAFILGRDPTDIDAKQHIGFLPEESYLYRFLNAEETLDFYGRLFNLPRKVRQRRTEELLRLVGLYDVRKRRLREYSKGMARRIGFAQALINDPQLVILDEPTSGLDPIVSRQLKDLIADLRQRGKTILMSSHLLADIEDVCDRIAILHLGILRKVGTVKELLKVAELQQITVKNLSPEAKAELEQVVARAGATVTSIENPSETLENLFLKTIRESQGGQRQDLGAR
ncbi:MAG: ABC transporter ATP-binding protein [Planctomycetes bacterium]|nr:ABC transporter ATP-binding protein [Planctomycetota bacterium]